MEQELKWHTEQRLIKELIPLERNPFGKINREKKKGAIAYVWHGSLHSTTVGSDLEDCGFKIIAQIIWNKQQMVFGQGDYHWKHEPCFYAVRKGENHNWQGDRTQTTIWDINNLVSATDEDSKQVHSTQKPIECMARPIQNNTAKGDCIYDPFGGSGTSMIAAHKLRRNCYMIELSENYCQGIVDRILKFDPQLKVTRNGKPYQPEEK